MAGTGGTVGAVAISPHGRALATGSAVGLCLWDVSNPVRPARTGLLPGDGRSVGIVAFEDAGSLLTVGEVRGTLPQPRLTPMPASH